MSVAANDCDPDAKAEAAALFAFRPAGPDRFTVGPYPTGLLRLYGGQLTSQALGAAQRTVPSDRRAHSCHAYFAAPGDCDRPVELHVLRDRDGRSFSSRRVVVEQGGELLMTLSASFHVAEAGRSYPQSMPRDLPPPEGLPSLIDQVRATIDRLPKRHWPFWLRDDIVEWRPIEPLGFVDPPAGEPTRHFWFRLRCPLGDDPAEHQCFLAYASDLHILHTAMWPLGEPTASDLYQTSSLDHAIWFHGPFRADAWLLYRTVAVAASEARALGGGAVFTRDGRHVATVMQEGLVRWLSTPRTDRL